MKPKTMEGKDWEKELLDLKCVNYNMYIGAGSEACDNCISFDEAVKELETFIRSLLKSQRQELKKKVEGMKKHGDVALGWGELTPEEWDFNETLDKVLTLLEEYESKN